MQISEPFTDVWWLVRINEINQGEGAVTAKEKTKSQEKQKLSEEKKKRNPQK